MNDAAVETPAASAAGSADAAAPAPVLLEQVEVWRSFRGERRSVLRGLDWRVGAGEHWGVMGPNGAGKSTLLQICAARIRPSRGRATILGGRLGSVSIPELRRRIGVMEPAVTRLFHPEQHVVEVVLSGAAGVIVDLDAPAPEHVDRARELLELVGAAHLLRQPISTCSDGERARVMLARALMPEAPLLVLDEPAARLDLGGREMLLEAFAAAVASRPGLATVTVTHHAEELPASTTHLLLLKAGGVVAAGEIGEVASSEAFSECFDHPLRVERRNGRLSVTSEAGASQSTTA